MAVIGLHRAAALLADHILSVLFPPRINPELVRYALMDTEDWQRHILHTETLAGAPAPSPPPGAPASHQPEFADLPEIRVRGVAWHDDDTDWWSDFSYLRSLADDIFITPRRGPAPRPIPRGWAIDCINACVETRNLLKGIS